MSQSAIKWQPIAGIEFPFGSLSYSFDAAPFASNALLVRMHGDRDLALRFSGVVAVRFEQECPGVDFPDIDKPMLGPEQTFPLLVVRGSRWREAFGPIHGDIWHFALVSSDHLLQVLAKPEAEARWESEANAA